MTKLDSLLGVTLTLWAISTSAAPVILSARDRLDAPYGSDLDLTPGDLMNIAPDTETCDGASFPTECRNATQAVGPINAAFAKYQITHPSVQAALVSLMVYETGSFKYSINHWPGRPGQGTRNMQMPAFNSKYASFLGITPSQDPAETLAAIQAQGDISDFGSAAWFVTSQCPFSIRQAMWGGSQDAYTAYLTDCVGTTPTSDRLAIWQKAIAAIGTS